MGRGLDIAALDTSFILLRSVVTLTNLISSEATQCAVFSLWLYVINRCSVYLPLTKFYTLNSAVRNSDVFIKNTQVKQHIVQFLSLGT